MAKVVQAGSKEGKFHSTKSYFAESLAELKKVHAPTKQEAWQTTIQVLVLIVFFSLVLAVMDWIFGKIMGWII